MLLQALDADQGKRIDSLLHERLPEYSRSRIQTWIRGGEVRIAGKAAKSSYLIRGNEQIEVEPVPLPPLRATPEDIPLSVLYEDESTVVIDKPAGMVVHAGAGNHDGTLVNALLHRFASPTGSAPTLSAVGGDIRPGIVHRLDRFTSGALLVAKTDSAHQNLALQFSSRKVEKIYLTLVEGRMEGSGRILKPIARDPKNRARMTAKLLTGRSALTDWEVVRKYADFTFLRIRLGTGRTHQIRAHLSSLGRPVAGDPLYGAKKTEWNRYFLHAHRLGFTSPATGEWILVESPLAPELEQWRNSLSIE